MTERGRYVVRFGSAEPCVWIAPSDDLVRLLRSQGMEPLSAHTGVVAELGPLWPAELSRDVRELGEPDVDEDLAWFVRSPWPSTALSEVIRLLWHWADTCQPGWEQRAQDLLTWSPERIAEFREVHPPAPS